MVKFYRKIVDVTSFCLKLDAINALSRYNLYVYFFVTLKKNK